MQRPLIATIVLFVMAVSAAADGPQATRAGNRVTELTADQQKVLDYLVAHWGRDTAVTSIDLGMKIVGGHYTSEDRYVLAVYIREHPELHRVVRIFGWVPVALTREEKVTARLLSRAEREHRPAPTMAELSNIVGASPAVEKDSLNMLERLGLVRSDPSAGGVGYRMSSDAYVDWEGTMKIDFMYHRVQVEGQDPLDTFWALDFIALVNAKWRDKKVTVDDASQYSGQRIHLVFEKGRVTELHPSTTRIFLGGGWGVNNLFSSEEEIAKWLEIHPELKGRPVMTVQQLLDKLNRGESLPL